jgi:hypothetical protein
MRSVRISFKSATLLIAGVHADVNAWTRAFDELRAAVDRVNGQAKAANARKSARIVERLQEVGPVRVAVMARAQGQCEACLKLDRRGGEAKRHALHMDHFFDKGAGHETLETCWALCANCHDRKHKMRPSLAFWFLAFAQHATRYGYGPEAAEALKSASAYRDRNALPASPRVTP